MYPGILNSPWKVYEIGAWTCHTSKNDQVAAINDMPLNSFEGEEMVFTSIDMVVHIGNATNYHQF